MRGRALLAAAIAVVCGLVAAFGSGLAAGGRGQRVRRCAGIVSAPLSHPRLLSTAPPVALSSILEVLRRPRSSSDELPPGGIPQLGYSVVWFNYVHFLASGPDRTRYYLILGIEDVQLPAVCLRLLSPSARREYEAEARAGRAGTVTLEAFNGEEESAATVYTAQAIEDGETLLAATDPSNSTLAIASVVPDGVASVTITAANGKTATGTVTNNLLLARPPANGLKWQTVRWYAADGSLIKTDPGRACPQWCRGGDGWAGPAHRFPAVRRGAGREGSARRVRTRQDRHGPVRMPSVPPHRKSGNPGPGPALTHVGSVLSRRGIEHALISPTAPMPSFRHLPRAKFKALVTFLSELR